MKVVTWQLIKGDTQTAPLLSYEDGKDLGMIHVSNAISKVGYGQRIPPTRAQREFEKCNDLFLYRYKRLNYGTRSAAEIFQETIREELTQDLKGVQY